MAVVVPEYTAVAEQIYIAYFGRPADRAGLINMTNLLATGQAPTAITDIAAAYYTNGAVKAIFDSFGSSTESTTLYTGTDAQFIVSIYHNVLGRDPLLTGLDFWTNALATHQMTRAEAAIQIMAAAQANATDAATIANKTTVATNFTAAIDTAAEDLGYNGKAAAQTARDMLSTVNSTTNTTDFNATIASTLSGLANGGNVGSTFNLTNGTDAFTGTAGNDTFVAGPTVVINPATGASTVVDSLQVVDTLAGGNGNDTLAVTIGNATTNVTPALSSIETVKATFTAAGTLNLSNATGTTSVIVNGSTAASTVAGVGAIANLTVSNIAAAAVNFDGQTATTLNLTTDTVGATSQVAVDLGATVASKATTINLTTTNSDVEIKDTTGANVVTSVSINATGENNVKLTDGLAIATLAVTGAGSVDLSDVNLVKVATLTVGDGGVTFANGTSTATTFSATTGAGVDKLTVLGANVKAISTGAGNDVVAVTNALAATSTIDLGAGDDTLNLAAAPAAGATLTGGAGKDTLGLTVANYNSVAAYAAADLAKITGFEILSVTDAAIVDGTTVDLSKIAGLTGFQSAGVAAGKAAIVTGVGAASDIILNGDLHTNTGALTVTLKDATGASDVLNLTINTLITQNADTTVDTTTATVTTTISGVETLNVKSTGTPSIDVASTAKADIASNTLTLTDTALVTLNVTGDQALSFTSAAGMTKLATIDATANTAGVSINASAAATDGTAAALTIKGSLTAANVLVGSGNNDIITGGAKGDVITGGAGADQLNGGAGNDTFKYLAATDSTLVKLDVITGFAANTYGNGVDASAVANGSAGTGAGTAAKWTGDVLDFSAASALTTVVVGVYTNASDAQVFLQNNNGSTNVGAALDSTTGKLYIDLDANGTVDSVIQLTGVTTLTAAAFVL
jgi:S-layer protein